MRLRFPLLVPPGRDVRVVARVGSLRATPLAAPVATGGVTTRGGLSFADPDPASGSGVAAAAPDPGALFLALRFREARAAAGRLAPR